MFDNIGYKTYLVFMCFCVVGFFYAVFLLPELKGESLYLLTTVYHVLTTGLSLEEVDAIFNDTSGAEDRARRERVAKQIGLDKIAQDVQHKEAVPGAPLEKRSYHQMGNSMGVGSAA